MLKTVALFVALNAGDDGVNNAQQIWVGDGSQMSEQVCENFAAELNEEATDRGSELYFFCGEAE